MELFSIRIQRTFQLVSTNYIVRLTEPVFYNGVPSDVFVQEGHIFIGRDDPVIPTCGLTQ